jgi:hypothetical protein
MDNQSLRNQAALTCWKDIAQYLGKGVRTVQRWELELELPVKRPNGGGSKGPVAADPTDLDRWLSSRWSRRSVRKSDGAASAAPEDMLRTQALLQTTQVVGISRKLRAENRALLIELMGALSQLHRTCQNGAGLHDPKFEQVEREAGHPLSTTLGETAHS